jgi:Zn-dependent protease with chaperone function
MQFLILALFIGLFMHDALAGSPVEAAARVAAASLSNPVCLALVLGPKLAVALLYHLLCRRAIRQMARGRSTAPIRRLERVAAVLKPIIIGSFLADLFALDALVRLRLMIGDLVLVDEVLIMLPALVATAWMWLAYYPVDVRMRQATFMSRIERGEPVHIWTRGQFILSQVRHQWALMGLPLLLLAGWWESVQKCFGEGRHEGFQGGLMLGGALVIFLFTPVMIRHVWDTVPLPAGSLRDTLMGMCRQYCVGVRELLLWRTFGGMINGAVMGLFGPLRYILLTDGLLETMPARQVEAVMAHELAHVRKHHMFWLLAVAASSMDLLRSLADIGIRTTLGAMNGGPAWLPEPMAAAMADRQTPQLGAMALSMIAWFFIFGWVSRRFERQADTFAVQHLARQWHEKEKATADTATHGPDAEPPRPMLTAAELVGALETGKPVAIAPQLTPVEPGHIPSAAADVMAGALQTVADLNCIPTKRKSWRHGSIAWRQNYLRSLTGTPIDDTSIDRQVRRIKLAGVVILVAAVAVQMVR